MYRAKRIRRPVSATICQRESLEMKLDGFTAALDKAYEEKECVRDCHEEDTTKLSEIRDRLKEKSRITHSKPLESGEAFEHSYQITLSVSSRRRINTVPLPRRSRHSTKLPRLPFRRGDDERENADKQFSRSRTSNDLKQSEKKSNLSFDEIREKYSKMTLATTAVPVKEKVAMMELWGQASDRSTPKPSSKRSSSISSTNGQSLSEKQLSTKVQCSERPAPQNVVSATSRLKPPIKPPRRAARDRQRRSMSDPNLQKSFQAVKELWDKKVQTDSKPQIPLPSGDHKSRGNSGSPTKLPEKAPTGKCYKKSSSPSSAGDVQLKEKKSSSPASAKLKSSQPGAIEDYQGDAEKKADFIVEKQTSSEPSSVKDRAKMFDIGVESMTNQETNAPSLNRSKHRPTTTVDEGYAGNSINSRKIALENAARQESVSPRSVNNNDRNCQEIRSDLARLLDFEAPRENNAVEDLMSNMRRNSANLAKERRRHVRRESNHSDSDSSCSAASSLSSTSVEGPVVLRRSGSKDETMAPSATDKPALKTSPVVKSYLYRNASPKEVRSSPTQAAKPPKRKERIGSLPERRGSEGSVASSGNLSQASPVAARRQSSLHREHTSSIFSSLDLKELVESPTSALHRKLSLDASKRVSMSADSGTGTVSPGIDRNSRSSTKSLSGIRDSDSRKSEAFSRRGGSFSSLSSLTKVPPVSPNSDKPNHAERSVSPTLTESLSHGVPPPSTSPETSRQTPLSGCISFGQGADIDKTSFGSTTTISSRMSLLSELGQGTFNAEDEYNRILDDLAASASIEKETTKRNAAETTTAMPALVSRDSLEIPSRKSGASDNDSFSDYDPSDVDDDGNQMGRVASVESRQSADAAAPAQKVSVEVKLHNIAKELLTTEATYVDVLHLIDQIFHKRVVEAINKKQISSDVKNIFSNVSAIYQFHSGYLLPQLKARIENWEANPKLGDIMKQAAPFLKMYSLYVQNFDDAMTMIKHWSEKSTNFANIIKQTQAEEECGNLSLEHHMLGPVQRIPRYKMLLDDYLKRLPEDSPDRQEAETALQLISQAATHSNESMRQSDKFNKLLSIYNNLVDIDFDIVNVSRELIKDGKIIKISARNGEKHERYLYLFNDMLLCCTPLRRLQRKHKVTARIDLDGMKVTDVANIAIPNTFCVHGTKKSMEFAASTPEAKEKWVNAISDAIDSFLERKTSFLKSSCQRKLVASAVDVQPPGSPLAKSDSQPQLRASLHSQSPGHRPISFEEIDTGSEEKRVEITCAPGSHHYLVDIADHDLGKRAPRWIKDNEVTMCMNCSKAFNRLLRRRHHCRACGRVICTECSEHKVELQYDTGKPHKVCNKCHAILTGGKNTEVDKKGVLEVEADTVSEDSVISEYLHFTESEKKKAWMKMWCVIPKNEPCLYVYGANQDIRAVMTMPLPGFTIVEDSSVDREFSFKLVQTRKVLLFSASSQEQKDRWKFVFEKAATGEVPTREEVFMSSPKEQEDPKVDLHEEEASSEPAMANGSNRMSYSSAESSNISASSGSDSSSRPSSLMDQTNPCNDAIDGVSNEGERFFQEALMS